MRNLRLGEVQWPFQDHTTYLSALPITYLFGEWLSIKKEPVLKKRHLPSLGCAYFMKVFLVWLDCLEWFLVLSLLECLYGTVLFLIPSLSYMKCTPKTSIQLFFTIKSCVWGHFMYCSVSIRVLYLYSCVVPNYLPKNLICVCGCVCVKEMQNNY